MAIGLLLTLSLGAFSAWQTYSAPIDCTDGYGHGPDQGTLECEGSIRSQTENRPQIIQQAFLAPIPWCLAGLAFVLFVQGMAAFLRSRGIEF